MIMGLLFGRKVYLLQCIGVYCYHKEQKGCFISFFADKKERLVEKSAVLLE